MLAAQIQPDFTLAAAPTPEPALPEGGALLQVTGCGLCGSDMEKIHAKKAPPGSVLGHEVVGRILALDAAHTSDFRVGDRIVTSHHVPCLACQYCLNGSESMCRGFKQSNIAPGGFAQVIALTAGHLQHTVQRIPEDISDAEASCVEPLACVLRAVRRGGTQDVNGSVAVVGLGFIGLLASQLYQQAGYQVFGVDISPERLALAQQEGLCTNAVLPDAMTAELEAKTPLGRVDLVFLSVVTPKTLAQALDWIRDGGKIVLFATGPTPTTMDPATLYFREISVIPSYSPALEDLREAARLIFERRIRIAPLMTHTVPLANIEEAIALYRSGQAVKVLVQP